MTKKKKENLILKLSDITYNNKWIFIIIGFIPAILSLTFEFTNWDDPGLVLENPSIRSLSVKNIVSIFTPQKGKTYQPVRVLSYALDYKLGKLNPLVYHLHNLLLFSLNLFVIYLFLIRFVAKEIAFISALIWAVMPVHIESVAWIAARKEVLSGLFFFLSLLLYVDFKRKRKIRLYIFSVFSFVLAGLSKPTTVVLPLILFFYELFFEKKKRFAYHIPYWIPNLLILAYFIFWGGAKKPSYHGGTILATLFTNAYIALRYWINMFIPISLSPRYLIDVKSIFPSWRIVVGILFVLFLFYIAWRTRKNSPLISFSIIWFFISLLPVLNIIPISTMIADRYIYIPSLGAALCFGFLGEKAMKKWQQVSYVLIGYLLVLTFLSVSYSRIWKNSFTLWSYVIKKEPCHPLAHHNLGLWYVEKGENIKAYKEFKIATECDPGYANAFKSLSGICWKLGKYDEGIEAGIRAVNLYNLDPDAYYNLANNYLSSNRLEDARLSYLKAAELAPYDSKIWLNLGIVYYNKKEFDLAVKYFEKAKTLNPNEPLSYLNLCATYFQMNRLTESKNCYESFIALFPGSPEAFTAKGAIETLDSLFKVGK